MPTDPDPMMCRALAADLASAEFFSHSVRAAWGDLADDAAGRGRREPAMRALGRRDDSLAVLARLFVLGMPQPAADVERALDRTGVSGVVALGLAQHQIAATVHPLALVRPQSFDDDHGAGNWWIASDVDEAALGGGPLPEDHVLGVGGASQTLAALQLPMAAARVLDVGTGCGIQALRARRGADRVVATDVSERALWFTRLNARLNGIDGIETRLGSMFDPVAGERFDHVVSNPPFVITPRQVADVPAYEYRDGGMVGDGLVESFVTSVGEHLNAGGVAQLLGNWETRESATGLDRVREWVQRSAVPLDAWVIERETLDPIAYAELWIRDGGIVPGSAEYARLIEAWLDDFSDRGVSTVGFGYILLRRPPAGDGPTLARYERLPHAAGDGVLGTHLASALAAHDRLTALDDSGLAASVFRVAPDVTEARHYMPGAEDPSVIELHQGGGFARSMAVDPALAGLVGACDGDLPVGSLSDAVADLLGADAGALRADLLPRVRELLFTGFLRFAS